LKGECPDNTGQGPDDQLLTDGSPSNNGVENVQGRSAYIAVNNSKSNDKSCGGDSVSGYFHYLFCYCAGTDLAFGAITLAKVYAKINYRYKVLKDWGYATFSAIFAPNSRSCNLGISRIFDK
jgi:hypothetical protein